ncbi:hypothetical protein TrST_g12932 [Triparma strigata]|uniref:Cystatin domain-containing protein n=1 Tax=Triparma strigata TaxID=1606541 RepID=A0A9W7EUC6_9STRA|nr:hypothetical protein TrST_g12932 [Triparma strigata]
MSDPICGGHSAPSDSEVPEDLTEIVKTLEGEIGSATGSTGPFEIKSFTQQVRFFLLSRRFKESPTHEEAPVKLEAREDIRCDVQEAGVLGRVTKQDSRQDSRLIQQFQLPLSSGAPRTTRLLSRRRRSARTEANEDAWLTEALLSLDPSPPSPPSPPRFTLADELAVWKAHADRCLILQSCGLDGFFDEVAESSGSSPPEPMLVDEEVETSLDDAGWSPPSLTLPQRRSSNPPTTQVVAGMIYHVKLAAAEEAYVHARIFKPLPHTGAAATLQVAKSGFGKDDELAVMNPE